MDYISHHLLRKGRENYGYIVQYWSRAMPSYITHLTFETYALCRTPNSFVGLSTPLNLRFSYMVQFPECLTAQLGISLFTVFVQYIRRLIKRGSIIT